MLIKKMDGLFHPRFCRLQLESLQAQLALTFFFTN